MSRKKGLSLDEKRERMLDYFHEQSSVFTIQQLEKGCSKQKGIVSQSVKDVLKSLVDDDMVLYDKIGAKNFYWSFPSEVAIVKNRRKDKLQASVTGLKRKRDQLLETEESEKVGREASDERDAKLRRLSELQDSVAKLQAEVTQYAALDPELLEEKKLKTKVFVNAANRWTDNIFAVRDYCKNKFSIEPDRFDQNFGTSDVDYVEL